MRVLSQRAARFPSCAASSFIEARGATLAGSHTPRGTTTTSVPLLDASGSTIAIVNAASPASPPATIYTYKPSGVPSVSGQASNYPFLYQGMENEFTDQQADFGQGILYYRGDGQFYSAQIARSFSLTGAQGTSGPGGAGGYSPAGRSLPPMFTPAGHESYWQWVESEDTSALEGTVSISSGEGSGGVPVGGIIYGIESLISFFEWAFGGSAGLPPNYFVFKARLERGKRHPLYDQIDGVPTDIVLNESPAAPKFCGDPHPCNTPPLNAGTARPSACSQYDAECAQSKGADTYACKAGACCRAFGDTPFADCTRGCLLGEEGSCFAVLFPPLAGRGRTASVTRNARAASATFSVGPISQRAEASLETCSPEL